MVNSLLTAPAQGIRMTTLDSIPPLPPPITLPRRIHRPHRPPRRPRASLPPRRTPCKPSPKFLSLCGLLTVAILFARRLLHFPSPIGCTSSLLVTPRRKRSSQPTPQVPPRPDLPPPQLRLEIARLVESTRPRATVDNALINAVLLAQDYHAASTDGTPQGSANAWMPRSSSAKPASPPPPSRSNKPSPVNPP